MIHGEIITGKKHYWSRLFKDDENNTVVLCDTFKGNKTSFTKSYDKYI